MEMSPQRLRVFLAVADTLHFGRAAERLRVSQPSVSQQVARLERELGCRLFERRPAGVELTEAGRDLVRTVGGALRGLDDAAAGFLSRHRAPRRLRVGLLSSLSDVLVPLIIASWGDDGAGIELTEGSLPYLTQQLRRGELDVAFCYRTGDAESLADLRIDDLDSRPVVVALREHDVLAASRELPWASLAERSWVMPSASRQYRDDMVRRFASRGLQVQIVAEATTLAGQLALVQSGIGLTFTSPWVRVSPELVTRPTAEPVERLHLVAARRTGTESGLDGLIAALGPGLAKLHKQA